MRSANWTQNNGVIGHIAGSAARAASSYLSETIDASIFDRLTALVDIGVIAGAGTLNVRYQHCSGSLSSDSAWADVSSANCITSTFTSANNGQIGELELRLDQPNSANSAAPIGRYVRALASAATSTWTGGVMVIGQPHYAPAKDVDSADVAQIVVY